MSKAMIALVASLVLLLQACPRDAGDPVFDGGPEKHDAGVPDASEPGCFEAPLPAYLIDDAQDIAALGEATCINGSLTVEGPEVALGDLGRLTAVNGKLALQHLEAESLDGLASLEHIEGLDVVLNENLTSLGGLSFVETLDDGLYIAENPSLDGLGELSNLRTVRRLFAIEGVANAGSFDELSFEIVEADVTLVGNAALVDLSLFAGAEVGDDGGVHFDIRENENLTSLAGLEQADLHTPLSLDIRRSASLQSIAQIASIPTPHTVRIRHAPNLTSLEGLGAIPRHNDTGFAITEGNLSLVDFSPLEEITHARWFSLIDAPCEAFASLATLVETTESIIMSPSRCDEPALLALQQVGTDLFIGAADDAPLAGPFHAATLTAVGDVLGVSGPLTGSALNTPLLTSVGSLWVTNTNVESIGVLTSLETIEGDLKIEGNQMLQDLDALSSLSFVGGDVVIMDNDLLTGAAASAFVAGIEFVGGSVEIAGQ